MNLESITAHCSLTCKAWRAISLGTFNSGSQIPALIQTNECQYLKERQLLGCALQRRLFRFADTTPTLSDLPFKVVPVQQRFPGCHNTLPQLPKSTAERRFRLEILRERKRGWFGRHRTKLIQESRWRR